jgi:hypothetical protein
LSGSRWNYAGEVDEMNALSDPNVLAHLVMAESGALGLNGFAFWMILKENAPVDGGFAVNCCRCAAIAEMAFFVALLMLVTFIL